MRLSLTADELALLDLALQDRMSVLQRMAGYGPLVTKQLADCAVLRKKLATLNTAKPPKRKTTQTQNHQAQDKGSAHPACRRVTIGAPCHER